MSKFQSLFRLVLFITLSVQAMGRDWQHASATFYGDMQGGETMQGACGYGNLFQQGYGLETAALSTQLFNDGHSCGACFEIMCVNDPQWCKPNAVIKVTATNFCPPNWVPAPDHWCNPPRKHFDLSMAMFTKLAEFKAGIIPVIYRRTPCDRNGGIKFEVKGNPYWTSVVVYNVAGAGLVNHVAIKGSNSGWISMTRNWGQVWQTGVKLIGQSLSFRVTAGDGEVLWLDNVAPANWQFGQTYEGHGNFIG
ncbi:expansin-A22-like [Rosa rugosa]|uniref:expansin-A22-like n=1 Tax=Rosa rugosa TaxID=74645 RepID=UPI002B40BCB7|nr:expansin-A22-like [Rosa rugosa]